MHTEYLIIGLGIAGTLLSFELISQGKSVIVIDDPSIPKASLVAGAIINPVNVSKWALAKHNANAISTALHTYRRMQDFLRCECIAETTLWSFHEDKAKQQLFEKEKPAFVSYMPSLTEADMTFAQKHFAGNDGFVKIKPVWRINASVLLSAWRNYLLYRNLLIEGHFDATYLNITSQKVTYKTIEANHITFCEGSKGMQNPFFKNLPFTKNRGEALLLSIPDLPSSNIYHCGIRLIPLQNDLFWCGSNYQWEFNDLSPDINWRTITEKKLKKWLTHSFTIVDHMVAERPTTAGQISFADVHPDMLRMAILNGLGTRGFSAGPLLAKTLAAKIIPGI
ncbi:MAG: FAD-dependent oxidoreductase [Agriterribacter sp.]